MACENAVLFNSISINRFDGFIHFLPKMIATRQLADCRLPLLTHRCLGLFDHSEVLAQRILDQVLDLHQAQPFALG